MKKLLITASVLAATASPALADKTPLATITQVEANYETQIFTTPYQSCSTVDVPIYGNVGSGASGGDVLTGMIIGGLLGKGVTGKDNGAAAGAVLGGVIAADKGQQQGIVGYRQEQRCTKEYRQETVEKLKNYRITYEWSGVQGSSYTYNQYSIGDRIPINVVINAK